MSDELGTGLAATANEPSHDTQPETQDAVLDAAFAPPAEGSEPSGTSTPQATANHPTADAIAQTQPTDATKTGDKGAPPPDKWEHVLENARKKTREETLAQYRDHLEVVAEMQRDFPGTIARLIEEGSVDPRFAETITAKAAALLAAKGKQAKANLEPEPDLQTADGALVYSAEQLRKWNVWNQNQTTAKLAEQFKPLQDLQQRFEQHQHVQQLTQEATAIAQERGATWKAMPFFEDHKDAILSRQQEIYAEAEAAGKRGERRFDPINTPWLALQQAYSEVIRAQALPKLQTQQTGSLVASAARKRAASSSDPAASAPAQPRKPRTVDEALDQVYETARA